jgi:CDP-diacylglycerol---glycerol-3-phosphate 3-phosphatidyltransferase
VISEPIGRAVRQYMLGVGRFFAGLGITPNMATLIGFGLNAIVAIVLASGYPRVAGVLLLIASAFDMVDGAIARSTGKTSAFGGFLDSTVDRYSEIVVYIGLLVWLNTTSDDHLGSLLVVISATGALMISYARARAEAIGLKASVGLVARPERVVLLAICLILNLPLIALWILAVMTHLTAVWRMVHVWRVTQAAPGESQS